MGTSVTESKARCSRESERCPECGANACGELLAIADKQGRSEGVDDGAGLAFALVRERLVERHREVTATITEMLREDQAYDPAELERRIARGREVIRALEIVKELQVALAEGTVGK